jgi:hypothetical protein
MGLLSFEGMLTIKENNNMVHGPNANTHNENKISALIGYANIINMKKFIKQKFKSKCIEKIGYSL